MESRILGTTMPVLEVLLEHGESVIAESGELSWMTSSIGLHTTTQKGGGGGFFGALKRTVAGGTLFMTEYTAAQGRGSVSFATKVPGQIFPIDVQPGRLYMIHRHGFLCGTTGVTLTIGFQKSLGAGIFGGAGFIMQKVEGQGHAWIELGGEIVSYDLAPGETLRVHPGHVGMFEGSVSFDVTMMPGIKNALFGGDGLFLAALTGPGRVWLQSLPVSRLAHALVPYLPTVENDNSGGAAGSLIKGLLNNN